MTGNLRYLWKTYLSRSARRILNLLAPDTLDRILIFVLSMKIERNEPITLDLVNRYAGLLQLEAMDAGGLKRLANDPRAVVISTIPKAGTFWISLFVGYYIKLSQGHLSSELEETPPKTMVDSLHSEHSLAFLNAHGISRIEVKHVDQVDCLSRARILFLYRNPLDQLWSMFLYRYARRRIDRSSKQAIDVKVYTFDEVLPLLIGIFARSYAMMQLAFDDTKDLRVSYEAFRLTPAPSFASVVSWMGLPLNDQHLRSAIALADGRRIRRMEAAGASYMHRHSLEPHAREGNVGQWRKSLTEAQVARIEESLRSRGIQLGDFLVELPSDVAALT